jgi:hypothetical protein
VSKQEQESALDPEQAASSLFELASGWSGRWQVCVDETFDGRTHFLELDGPSAYLCVRLRDLSVAEGLCRFLAANSPRETFPLGELAGLDVWLVWDDEDFIRCFLIVGKQSETTLRLSLDSEDARMLSEALKQTAEGLPEA